MEAQLRRNDNDAVIDTFMATSMAQHRPDRTRATRAAASRKATWSGHATSCVATGSRSLVTLGRGARGVHPTGIEAAAGVVSHMEGTLTPLRLEALERSRVVVGARCFVHGDRRLISSRQSSGTHSRRQPAEEDATDAAMASGSESAHAAECGNMAAGGTLPEAAAALCVPRARIEQGRLDAPMGRAPGGAGVARRVRHGDESAACAGRTEGVDLRGLDRGASCRAC